MGEQTPELAEQPSIPSPWEFLQLLRKLIEEFSIFENYQYSTGAMLQRGNDTAEAQKTMAQFFDAVADVYIQVTQGIQTKEEYFQFMELVHNALSALSRDNVDVMRRLLAHVDRKRCNFSNDGNGDSFTDGPNPIRETLPRLLADIRRTPDLPPLNSAAAVPVDDKVIIGLRAESSTAFHDMYRVIGEETS